MEDLHKLLKGNPLSKDQHDLTAGVVHVTAVHPPRFNLETERDDFLKYLDEHGYAVVARVADDQAVQTAKSLMWDYLESIPNTNVKRNDVTSWGLKGDWLPSETNGILHGFGIGQSDFMWHLRLLPPVKAAFSAIWNTDDLLVSFDGANAFRPWKYDSSWLTAGGWYHVDQNATKQESIGRCCIQGLVTLTDATEDTGGLVVISGSHTEHTPMCQRSEIAKSNGDFVPVPVGDPVLDKGASLICALAGDLILWDSRTVHCNSPSLTALAAAAAVADSDQKLNPEVDKERPVSARASEATHESSQWELIRQVGYVCMMPAKFASQEVLLKRQDAFVNNISLSHWPHKMAMAGHAIPDTPQKDPTSISKEQRALIGYDRQPGFSCTVS